MKTKIDEIWADVKGYEGLYKISNSGRVESVRRQITDSVGHTYYVGGKILSATPNRRGYLRVALYRENKGRTIEVHRLVTTAFLGNLPDGLETRHLDGNKTNNHVTNLVYGTSKENSDDLKRHGKYTCGPEHPTAKLTQQQVQEIRNKYVGCGGPTMRELGDEYGVVPTTIFHAVHKSRVGFK